MHTNRTLSTSSKYTITVMLTTVRMNAKLRWVARCSPPFSLLLRTCACLLLLLGPLAHSPVEGQYLRSPCPDVFSYRLDPGTNQVFGYVELQGLRIGQLVKLNVDLSIAIAVPQVSVRVRHDKKKPVMIPSRYDPNQPSSTVVKVVRFCRYSVVGVSELVLDTICRRYWGERHLGVM